MTLKTDARPQSPGEYNVVGTRPIRPDDLDKATGRARYGADVQMAGLLHGKILRTALTPTPATLSITPRASG